MATIVIVGNFWGDEAKAKTVDILSQKADMVCRFGGGSNAGHSVVINGKKTVLRLIPSGIFHPHTICVMAQGMVIDPITFDQEIRDLQAAGVSLKDRLFISDSAHIVMPYHVRADINREESSTSKNKIGTTKKGIGPCYSDKITRNGIRIGDLEDPNSAWGKAIEALNVWDKDNYYYNDNMLRSYLDSAQNIFHPYVCNTSALINKFITSGKNVLFEGAQGTLLDIDHGTYPYVTSSSAVAGGACTGAGVGPSRINKVIGVTKAYTTRVGEGPFPTELTDQTGDLIRRVGNEYGSVTKRPRRVGWLDIPALRYAAQINGLDGLVITKLDVLSGMDLKVCTGYNHEFNINKLEKAIPQYQSAPKWIEDLASARTMQDLPNAAQQYIKMIEQEVGVPVCMVSVGSDREQTIILKDIWEEPALPMRDIWE